MGVDVNRLLAAALDGRRLLDHPFYRRWEAGGLTEGELASYAAQYRYFEESLPVTLGSIALSLPDGRARDLVAANLADELGPPVSHIELFELFAQAVGATVEPPGQAVTDLVDVYRRAPAADPAEARAVVAADELQAGEIAATKAVGLRDHYGVGEPGTKFWDVHAATEADHARWTVDALVELDDLEAVGAAARRSAEAWWSFLDDRELAAGRLAGAGRAG
jgi:pyrroloquinoline quinone (PQQ) biosynthesis protein C